MKAKIKVTSGSVRIFGTGDSKRLREIEPVASPHEEEVDGGWGVGSASGLPAGVVAGDFEVEAVEQGMLRVYEAAAAGAPSTASHSVAFEAGAVKSFKTHDSNALTVQSVTGELAIPPEATETVKAPATPATPKTPAASPAPKAVASTKEPAPAAAPVAPKGVFS